MIDGAYFVITDIYAFIVNVQKVALVCQELVISEPAFRNVIYINSSKLPPPGRNMLLYSVEDLALECILLDMGGAA